MRKMKRAPKNMPSIDIGPPCGYGAREPYLFGAKTIKTIGPKTQRKTRSQTKSTLADAESSSDHINGSLIASEDGTLQKKEVGVLFKRIIDVSKEKSVTEGGSENEGENESQMTLISTSRRPSSDHANTSPREATGTRSGMEKEGENEGGMGENGTDHATRTRSGTAKKDENGGECGENGSQMTLISASSRPSSDHANTSPREATGTRSGMEKEGENEGGMGENGTDHATRTRSGTAKKDENGGECGENGSQMTLISASSRPSSDHANTSPRSPQKESVENQVQTRAQAKRAHEGSMDTIHTFNIRKEGVLGFNIRLVGYPSHSAADHVKVIGLKPDGFMFKKGLKENDILISVRGKTNDEVITNEDPRHLYYYFLNAYNKRPLRFSVSRKPEGCNEKRKRRAEEKEKKRREGSRLVRNDNVMGGGDARTCLMDAIVSVAPMGVDKERLWKEMVGKIQVGRDTSISDLEEELGNHGLVTKTVTREYIKKGVQRSICSKRKNARS